MFSSKNRKRVTAPTSNKKYTVGYLNKQCNINDILKTRSMNEIMAEASYANMTYLDISSLPSYQDALNIVIDADEKFLQLPSSIREKFGNNPQRFLDFVSDKNNIPEMKELGLLNNPQDRPEVDFGSNSSKSEEKGSEDTSNSV